MLLHFLLNHVLNSAHLLFTCYVIYWAVACLLQYCCCKLTTHFFLLIQAAAHMFVDTCTAARETVTAYLGYLYQQVLQGRSQSGMVLLKISVMRASSRLLFPVDQFTVHYIKPITKPIMSAACNRLRSFSEMALCEIIVPFSDKHKGSDFMVVRATDICWCKM